MAHPLAGYQVWRAYRARLHAASFRQKAYVDIYLRRRNIDYSSGKSAFRWHQRLQVCLVTWSVDNIAW